MIYFPDYPEPRVINPHRTASNLYGGDFLCSSGSDQCAFADPGHGFHLFVALAVVQKIHGMLQLTFVGQWVLFFIFVHVV